MNNQGIFFINIHQSFDVINIEENNSDSFFFKYICAIFNKV